MVNKDLLKYIEKELGKGFSAKQIKKTLLKAGHKIEHIEETLKHAYSKEKKWIKKEEKLIIKEEKKFQKYIPWKYVVPVVVVVLGLVIFFGNEIITEVRVNQIYLGEDNDLDRAHSVQDLRLATVKGTVTCKQTNDVMVDHCINLIRTNRKIEGSESYPSRLKKPIQYINSEVDDVDSLCDYGDKSVTATCRALVLNMSDECVTGGVVHFKCLDFFDRRDDFFKMSCDEYVSELATCEEGYSEMIEFGLSDMFTCYMLKAESEEECLHLGDVALAECGGCGLK